MDFQVSFVIYLWYESRFWLPLCEICEAVFHSQGFHSLLWMNIPWLLEKHMHLPLLDDYVQFLDWLLISVMFLQVVLLAGSVHFWQGSVEISNYNSGFFHFPFSVPWILSHTAGCTHYRLSLHGNWLHYQCCTPFCL